MVWISEAVRAEAIRHELELLEWKEQRTKKRKPTHKEVHITGESPSTFALSTPWAFPPRVKDGG